MESNHVKEKAHGKDATVKSIVHRKIETFSGRTINPTLPRIYEDRWFWRKSYWIVAYVLCWVVFIVTTIQLVQGYFAFGVNTGITLRANKFLTFPAVTICDLNRLERSRAAETRTLQDVVSTGPYMWARILEKAHISGVSTTCRSGYFRCNNSQCILDKFACDLYVDCFDGSDELNCPDVPKTMEQLIEQNRKLDFCTVGYSGSVRNVTHCCDYDNGEVQTILPMWAVCDGFHHCRDKSDESSCEYSQQSVFCPKLRRIPVTDTQIYPLDPKTEFCIPLNTGNLLECQRWCKDRCIPLSQVQDGVSQCETEMDEMNVTEIKPSAAIDNVAADGKSSMLEDRTSAGGFERMYFLDNKLHLDQRLERVVAMEPFYASIVHSISQPRKDIMDLGIDFEDLVKLCSFNNQPCSLEATRQHYWYPWAHHEYGKCFTFNHKLTQMHIKGDNRVRGIGPDSGLHLALHIDEDVYLPLLAEKVGAIVSVQSPKSYPRPKSKGVIMGAGTYNLMSLTKESTVKQGHPYSTCTDEYPSFIRDNLDIIAHDISPDMDFYVQKLCIGLCYSFPVSRGQTLVYCI